MMGRVQRTGWFRRFSTLSHHKATEALERVEMSVYRHRPIGQLSGGQQQRVFLARSLIEAVIVGIICAVVGSYLMVQRLALLGDAISHSVLPGLAIAFLLGVNIFVGAFIAGLLSTVLINLI